MNFQEAVEKFGKDRAEEIRLEIEQLIAEIDKLRSVPLDFPDEP
jgi:hypothetical protein